MRHQKAAPRMAQSLGLPLSGRLLLVVDIAVVTRNSRR